MLPRIENTPASSRFHAFDYASPIDFFITQLKFHDKLYYARWLGKWFIECAQMVRRPEAVLPVPLHRQRLQERGFNQALQIAKPIAQHFQVPILRHEVIRHKKTLPQTKLTPIQRTKNVKNAFSLKKPIPFRHIAIIDDVLTTGSTLNALSACLKDSGVEQIDIWTLAKVC